MHGIKNILHDPLEEFSLGSSKKLSTIEFNLVIALLKAFTLTDYKGNSTPVKTRINPHVSLIPKIQIPRKEILRLMEIPKNHHRKSEMAMLALEEISEKEFFFKYKRLCYCKNGIPIKTPKGEWEMEMVETEEPFFSIKKSRHSKGKLDFIEIVPATIFIDQINNYYTKISDETINKLKYFLPEKKRASSSINYAFLFFCQKLELKRRRIISSKTFKIAWNDFASIIGITHRSILKEKTLVKGKINKAMEICNYVGLIKSWRFEDGIYVFDLSEKKSNMNLGKSEKQPIEMEKKGLSAFSYSSSKRSGEESGSPEKIGQEIEGDKTESVGQKIPALKDKTKKNIDSKQLLGEMDFGLKVLVSETFRGSLYNFKLEDGNFLNKATVDRWIRKRNQQEIQSCIEIYKKQAINISPGKHEAYLQTLISKNSGVAKTNSEINLDFAISFKKEQAWKELEIRKQYVIIYRGGDKETLNFSLNPDRFSINLKHLYASFKRLNI